MAIKVYFVAAIGRDSVGDQATRPYVAGVVAKHGGTLAAGGVGSSEDPLVADFGANASGAKEAAAEAWYHDSVESAYVRDEATGAEAATKDLGEAEILKAAVDSVVEGGDVGAAVDALIEGKKMEKEKKEKGEKEGGKEGKGDTDDKGEKK